VAVENIILAWLILEKEQHIKRHDGMCAQLVNTGMTTPRN
jgi:hypothetical protein